MASRGVILFAVLGAFYLSGVQSGLVTRCKTEDTKCAKESAQAMIAPFAAGIPEYNVKTLDPVTFKRVDASSPNLKLILTDITITGLKDTIVKKVKRDKSKNKMFLKFVSSVQLEGNYEMKGQLLILSMEGKGPLHVTLRKAEFSVEVDIFDIEKDGKTYWDARDWKYSYALKDKSDVEFENLFDGNEDLANAAREIIKENGNEIIMEVGTPMIDATMKEVFADVKSMFHTLSADQLSLD
ncbi:protein takeout-like [Epargyreus clarus]|uniref:protein takeout-like n=1 Tax=Epargyreus clarus TaxID=520877 RepID=UPI003C2F88C7